MVIKLKSSILIVKISDENGEKAKERFVGYYLKTWLLFFYIKPSYLQSPASITVLVYLSLESSRKRKVSMIVLWYLSLESSQKLKG